MTNFSLLVVAVIAAVWYASVTDTASIKPKDMQSTISTIIQNRIHQGIRRPRAIKSETEGLVRYCYNTPCGWEVYKPFTRRHEYFMKNTCECPDSTYKCVRTHDDLSVSAYVYRCRQNTTAEDIEPPEYAS